MIRVSLIDAAEHHGYWWPTVIAVGEPKLSPCAAGGTPDAVSKLPLHDEPYRRWGRIPRFDIGPALHRNSTRMLAVIGWVHIGRRARAHPSYD
jgi:hypothetical protein